MKACGIIVEYNPFHNGHIYHGKMARKLSTADVVVAVMSGNFLQRGEPAIVDKWSRADAALHHGIDLVIELPLCFSLQSADLFAKGAVAMLQAIGCESLCFGTEENSAFNYQAFGKFIYENEALIDHTYREIKDEKLSYPQKMTRVYQQLFPDFQLSGNTPNHLLALTYARENAAYDKPMTLYPLMRLGAGYHETDLTETIASGTGIRQAVAQNQGIADFVPVESQLALKKHAVDWQQFWPYLRYRLLQSTPTELQEIYQMVEGLEHRLLAAVDKSVTYDEFFSKVKSKRYTKTRLQRLFSYVLLNITKEEMQQAYTQQELKILGFTKQGREFLRQQKKQLSLPLTTLSNRPTSMLQELSKRGDSIYALANPAIKEQRKGRFPLQV